MDPVRLLSSSSARSSSYSPAPRLFLFLPVLTLTLSPSPSRYKRRMLSAKQVTHFLALAAKRTVFTKLRRGARILQRGGRQWLARRHEASYVVVRAMRKNLERRRRAAQVLVCIFLRHRRIRKAMTLQRIGRGFLGRLRAQELRAQRMIQRVARGFLARRLVRRIKAVRTISGAWAVFRFDVNAKKIQR